MAARQEVSEPELEEKLLGLYGAGLDNLSKADAGAFIKIFQEHAA